MLHVSIALRLLMMLWMRINALYADLVVANRNRLGAGDFSFDLWTERAKPSAARTVLRANPQTGG